MLATIAAILGTITLGLLGRVIWPREVKQLAQLSDLECGDYPRIPAELKTAGNNGPRTELSHPPLIDHSHSSHFLKSRLLVGGERSVNR